MRSLYDDFDEFEFDDSVVVRQMLKELQREEVRRAVRRKNGPGNKKRWDDEPDDDFGDYESYEEYDESNDYEDYDDDEFDAYSGLDTSMRNRKRSEWR